MANLPEVSQFVPVYQIEETDLVQGGVNGVSNTPLKNLTDRTLWLKNQVEALKQSGFAPNGTLNPLATITGGPIGQYNLTVADAGKLIVLTNGNGTTTDVPAALVLPDPTTGVDGHTYAILNASSVAVPISATSATIYDPLTGTTWRTQGIAVGGQLEPGDLAIFVNTPTFAAGSTGAVTTSGYIKLLDQTAAGTRPAGQIAHFARNTPPTGWLEANGAEVSRTVYARLFAAIGTTFGSGNGTTTFRLPDLRGEFIRGWDNGRGIDTDTSTFNATRTNGSGTLTGIQDTSGLLVGMQVTGTGIPVGATIASILSSTSVSLSATATSSGTNTVTFSRTRTFGSNQVDMFKRHQHIMKKNNLNAGASGGFFAMDDQGTDGSENTEPQGGSETRPRNVALLVCISV